MAEKITDEQIVSFIEKGMAHEYIRLSKKKRRIKNMELLALDESMAKESCEEDIEERIMVRQALKRLTPLQRKILIRLVVNGEKEKDIAKAIGVTQQAISNIKIKALAKMKRYLE